MVIDNFSLIRPHLEFSKAFSADGRELGGSFDRYVINVLKRAKDCGGKRFGSNEGSRLIATFVVSNLEYFDRKADCIRELCRSNGARAYILPQPRSSRDCLAEMIRIAANSIDDPSVNLSHLVKTATCGNHRSRRKTFVFDLDSEKYDDDDSVVFFSEIATSSVKAEGTPRMSMSSRRRTDGISCRPRLTGANLRGGVLKSTLPTSRRTR